MPHLQSLVGMRFPAVQSQWCWNTELKKRYIFHKFNHIQTFTMNRVVQNCELQNKGSKLQLHLSGTRRCSEASGEHILQPHAEESNRAVT